MHTPEVAEGPEEGLVHTAEGPEEGLEEGLMRTVEGPEEWLARTGRVAEGLVRSTWLAIVVTETKYSHTCALIGCARRMIKIGVKQLGYLVNLPAHDKRYNVATHIIHDVSH